MAKELTEMQSKFLDLLFQEGLPLNLNEKAKEAAKAVGYQRNEECYRLLRVLKDEVVERTKEYLIFNAAESITKLQEIQRMPNTPGADNVIKAANSLLDRGGFGKDSPELEVKLADKGIVILPAKLE